MTLAAVVAVAVSVLLPHWGIVGRASLDAVAIALLDGAAEAFAAALVAAAATAAAATLDDE